MLAHVFAGDVPDRQEHAMPLVVARPVLVRFAEIPDGDRTVDGGNDLGESDLVGRATQYVPAADSAL